MSSTRILVIGATGMMGQHLAKASLAAGHPTALLVRRAGAADPSKIKLLEALKASGADIVKGDMNNHESLVAAIKQTDVVISAVGHHGPEDLHQGQLNVVAAINEAGNVKRFVPSEYGMDVEQGLERLLEPARSILHGKLRVREAVRAAGIPHTFICSYWAHGFLLPRLGDPQAEGPPLAAYGCNKVTIFGDDNTRAIFVDEKDMSTVVIKAVEDPRALNKIIYVRPAANMCSLSHLVRLWEQKTGRALDKHYMPEEELVRKVQESPMPLSFQLAMVHATVAPGGGVCEQSVDASAGVEATDLYPDINFVTVEEYLDALSTSE